QLFHREKFTLRISQKSKWLGLFVEFFIRNHPVLHQGANLIPLLFEFFSVVLEKLGKLVRDLPGDVTVDFFHVGVTLQIAPRHVERNVRRIDHTVQQREKLRYYLTHLIRDKNLIGVQLYLVLLDLYAFADLWKIQDPCQIERVIDIEVDPEQRLLAEGI